MQGKDLQTILTLVDDPAVREHLLDLNRRSTQAMMSPEQILAGQAGSSPAAAQALAQMLSANQDALRRQIEDERQRNRGHAEQLERILDKAMAAMSESAEALRAIETINKLN